MYKVRSTIISRFLRFRIFQETCAHKNLTRHRHSKQTWRVYSIFADLGIPHALTEVASTLFYHLSSLCFTYSQFAPTFLFASAYDRACCHHSRSHLDSAGCCVPIPPYIGFCCRTSTTASYKHLLSLQCQSKLSEMAEKAATLYGRSVSPLPSSSCASFSISSSSYASSVS